jgi:L-rhamnose isomerase / sugar isomerase
MKSDPSHFPERQQRVKGLAQTISTSRNYWRTSRNSGNVLEAHRVLMRAFKTDVTRLLENLREEMGVPADPIRTHRQSDYLERVTNQRGISSASGGFPT